MRRFFYILGFILLLAGYAGAVIIWRAQDRLETGQSPDAPLNLLDSRKDSDQVERLEGKEGLVMEQLVQWLGSFLHGKRLAGTLVAVSSVAAIGCFIAAARQPFQSQATPSAGE